VFRFYYGNREVDTLTTNAVGLAIGIPSVQRVRHENPVEKSQLARLEQRHRESANDNRGGFHSARLRLWHFRVRRGTISSTSTN